MYRACHTIRKRRKCEPGKDNDVSKVYVCEYSVYNTAFRVTFIIFYMILGVNSFFYFVELFIEFIRMGGI